MPLFGGGGGGGTGTMPLFGGGGGGGTGTMPYTGRSIVGLDVPATGVAAKAVPNTPNKKQIASTKRMIFIMLAPPSR